MAKNRKQTGCVRVLADEPLISTGGRAPGPGWLLRVYSDLPIVVYKPLPAISAVVCAH